MKVPNVHRTYILIALFFCLAKLYTWGLGYYLANSGSVEFNKTNYLINFHHIELDPRIFDERKTSFFKLWNYADCEWYLSIAQSGYPSLDQIRQDMTASKYYLSTQNESFRKYVFFPLFPILIYLFKAVLPLEPAAFTANLIINFLTVIVFWYFVKQYFPEEKEDAAWPFALMFLFPFSIFYSLYYPESLFLLLSMLVFMFMRSGKYPLMAASGLLLSLTRPNGMLIFIPVLFYLYANRREFSGASIKKKLAPYLFALIIPSGLLIYFAFIYFRTGHWDFYYTVHKTAWVNDLGMIKEHLLYPIYWTIDLFTAPQHPYYASKIYTVIMLLFGAVIAVMWFNRKFPRELTLWSAIVWVLPLVTQIDLMSFPRYMSVSFPVFLFLGLRTGKARYYLIIIFTIAYFYALKAVIQYNWLA